MDSAWSVKLVINGVLTVTDTPILDISVKYSNFKLNFDVDANGAAPTVNTGSVNGSYKVDMDMKLPQWEGQAGTKGTVQSGSSISDPQFTFTRKIVFAGAPELDIDDGNPGQPDNTLDIKGDCTLSGIKTATFAGSLSGSGTTTMGAPIYIRIKHGVENPIIISAPTKAEPHTIQGQAKATVKKNMGSIKMEELSLSGTDVTTQPGVAKGSTYSAGSAAQTVNHRFDNDTLAGFIHANIRVTVRAKDGSDISSEREAIRYVRDWMVPLKPLAANATPKSSDGGVSGRAGQLTLKQAWMDDGTGWVDVPGSAVSEAVNFDASRLIQEFMWGVKKGSDLFTPIYYLVVTDLRPPHWSRIRVFKAVEIKPDVWAQIKGSSGPWKNETGSTQFDSGWVNHDVIPGSH